ncbi:MAG: UDP-3-O-(3-hydroxymyristoyl)glucosamine N-acyltransferase [Bacteroidetes bacterium]|nr:UDP-3-O-(3-hydroxymyristoyl)glucosamine N-acyltransferase [Bacteroidota bacterium]
MIALTEILKKTNPIKFIGNDTIMIRGVISLDIKNERSDVIYWCNDKNINTLSACKAGTIICSIKGEEYVNSFCNYIIVENPRLVFSQILKDFFIPKEKEYTISPKANIHPSVKIGKGVFVGDNTVIEEGCIVGDNTYIGHNNSILTQTSIGSHVKIGHNNTIGGVGFGYEKNEQGNYEVLPHIGNVVIHDKVEIGNNTCIDRAVLGSTVLHTHAKIDNLVHIAHGVVIEENTLIIAHAMIGGSTTIGKNVWVAPGALVINKTTVGDNSLVGMGAVVVKKVDANTIVAGNPAKFLKNI